MDEWHVAAGALTGFVVGMTGVGGGALMTPILVLALGTAPLTAVGTDLWFAAITKMAVSGLHIRQGLIDWPVVRRMWLGSLPASALTVYWMSDRQMDPAGVAFVTSAIAIAVCATAVSLIYAGTTRGNDRAPAITTRRHKEQTFARRLWASVARTPAMHASVAAGAALGGLVTLTSVGAGALGVVMLMRLYPSRLTPPRLVATDIAHAIPLALCAGLGHLAIGRVDVGLLRDLLVGSIPAALIGAVISSRVPHGVLRMALGAVLLAIGVTMLAGVM